MLLFEAKTYFVGGRGDFLRTISGLVAWRLQMIAKM